MTACDICSTTEDRVEAEPGQQTCTRCSTRLLRHLREVEACLDALDAVPATGTGGRRAPGFGSRSPARDDVILVLDPRSRIDRHQPTPAAMAALTSWCQLVSEERQLRGAQSTSPADLCGYLRRHHGWITAQPWIAEYATELRGLRDQVRALAGLAPEPPKGRCWHVFSDGECGGPLWWTDDRESLRCGDCQRIYTGLDLIRWQAAQKETA